jgi:hypothetical protein
MQTLATEIDQMIVQLNQYILPSSLMESFDVYREECVREAARNFNQAQLSWFVDLLNRYRGPDDRKDSLVDIFDPGMYTVDHAAWKAAPGTRIEMPALVSDVAKLVDRDSEFAEIARTQINEFRHHAKTYSDDEILGLARVAASALVDREKTFQGRQDAIRYLALNASSVIEDLWATDDTPWKNAPVRYIEFDDMVAKRKVDLLKLESIHSSSSRFTQARVDSLFVRGKGQHLLF